MSFSDVFFSPYCTSWFMLKGMTCLNKHMSASSSSSQEETQATCNPDEAIPLFYEPLFPKQNKTEPCSAEHNTAPPSTPNMADSLLSTYQSSGPSRSPSERWHLLSKVLLYRKAAMAYYSLATITMESQKYGAALKYIKLAILCFGRWLAPCIFDPILLWIVKSEDFTCVHSWQGNHKRKHDVTLTLMCE